MTYNEYLVIIDLAGKKEELEKILDQIEDDEEISARAYASLRTYVIDRLYK